MKFLIYFVLCLPVCFAIDCNKKNVTNDGFICQSPNYPENYTAGTCECNFQVDLGYKIEVFIEDLNLDSSGLDNILITGAPDDKQIKCSWFLNTTKKYFFENNHVSLKFEATHDAVNYSGFSVHFRRYGGDLTTIAPSTEIPWPNPSNEDKIYHTIFLKMAPKEFKLNESVFQNVMVNVSTIFCQVAGYKLVENITTRNIIINSISNCLIDWPDSKNCVQIRYALPIILKSKDYELERTNLEEMWTDYGKDAFAEIGWIAYDVPDTSTSVMWWITLCCIILIVFGVFLYGMKVMSLKINFSSKRRRSDTMHITCSEKTNDASSLSLTHSQIVPSFFETESRAVDNMYVDFESGYQQNAGRTQQQLPSSANQMMSYDESSDDDILDIAKKKYINYNPNVVTLNEPAGINRESSL